MPTLYLRNVPEIVYHRLSERAASEHRSVTAEALKTLEESVGVEAYVRIPAARPRAREEIFHSAKEVRDSAKFIPDGVASMQREDRDR